jgi:hypothetical protein
MLTVLRLGTWDTNSLNEINCVGEKQTFRKIVVYVVSKTYDGLNTVKSREDLILTLKIITSVCIVMFHLL